MKAKEALEISVRNQYKYIAEIEEFIVQRALNGKQFLTIECVLTVSLYDELKKSGYKVESFKKDGESYITISW